MSDPPDIARLKRIARKLRANVVRMIAAAGSGHNGGSLSAIDVITYLYFHRMRIDPASPRWPDRDRFVLSKGHCCPAPYAVLAVGAIHPRQGFCYAFRNGADFVHVGMFDFEIAEDCKIAQRVLGGNLGRQRPWRA